MAEPWYFGSEANKLSLYHGIMLHDNDKKRYNETVMLPFMSDKSNLAQAHCGENDDTVEKMTQSF